MTREEVIKALDNYCDKQESCTRCKLDQFAYENCECRWNDLTDQKLLTIYSEIKEEQPEVRHEDSKLWGYKYEVEYWSGYLSKTLICSGVVLAMNTIDAMNKLHDMYIDSDEDTDFNMISVEALEFGDGTVLELTEKIKGE